MCWFLGAEVAHYWKGLFAWSDALFSLTKYLELVNKREQNMDFFENGSSLKELPSKKKNQLSNTWFYVVFQLAPPYQKFRQPLLCFSHCSTKTWKSIPSFWTTKLGGTIEALFSWMSWNNCKKASARRLHSSIFISWCFQDTSQTEGGNLSLLGQKFQNLLWNPSKSS